MIKFEYMNIKFNATHIKSGEEYNYNEETENFDGKPEFDNNQVVLPPNKEYILVISYPLTNEAKFKIKSNKNGLTRTKLVSIIRKNYQKVYDIENGTTKIKPSHLKQMFNRNSTDGTFGIWGHDIGDLVLVDASVSTKNVIRLGVDS